MEVWGELNVGLSDTSDDRTGFLHFEQRGTPSVAERAESRD